MAIASITAWLTSKNRDFHHGRLLYEQYGTDKLILTIIRTGSSSYHHSKLVAGLEELNKNVNLVPKPIVFKEPDPVEKPGDSWEGAPDTIFDIRNRKNKLYAQARARKEAIAFMDSAEHRLEAALIMLDEMDEVRESWAVIDEWRETGKVRELRKQEAKEDVTALSLKDLLKKRNNTASYVSKDRKSLETATDAKTIVKLRNRLEIRELQLAEMNKRIDGLE